MGGIDGYQDIHANVRVWINRLAERLAAPQRRITVWDVGANDGELTVPLAAAGHVVIAFEPGAEAAGRLVARARDAGVAVRVIQTLDGVRAWPETDDAGAPGASGEAHRGSVTVVPVALGDRDGQALLHIFDDDTFSSFYERSPEERERYRLGAGRAVPVPVVALDTLVRRMGVPLPDLVKIDVEGAEEVVLAGAAKAFAKARPALLMEYSCVNARNAGFAREQLLDLLRDAGLTHVRGLWRNEDLSLHAEIDDCRIWNIIAVAPDRRSLLERA